MLVRSCMEGYKERRGGSQQLWQGGGRGLVLATMNIDTDGIQWIRLKSLFGNLGKLRDIICLNFILKYFINHVL